MTQTHKSNLAIFHAPIPTREDNRLRAAGLLDVYGGPQDYHDYVRDDIADYDPEELPALRYQQRMLDMPGQDSAYENGISAVALRAPKGGWPLDTPEERLEV